jgi:5-methyltetrahydrofolate--homocysteine methyltransferase
MGTMIQTYRLDEAAFRGERFRNHPKDLKGNNDLLCLTQPGIIAEIHRGYFEAGADIVTTNTFNATSVVQVEYGLQDLVYEIARAAASIARKEADTLERRDPSRPRFVAGSLAPTSRTASISPDVNDPGFRNVTFRELADAYRENAQGLIDGGADILLVETVFDTLNAKAALFAIEEEFEARGSPACHVLGHDCRSSGRTLSGQTPEAFYASVSHILLAVGLNCRSAALNAAVSRGTPAGADSPSAVSNGLPNAFAYDEAPDEMALQLGAGATAANLIAQRAPPRAHRGHRRHVGGRHAAELLSVAITRCSRVSRRRFAIPTS